MLNMMPRTASQAENFADRYRTSLALRQPNGLACIQASFSVGCGLLNTSERDELIKLQKRSLSGKMASLPPSQISLNGLAVPTHNSAPSSPLGDRNGEATTFQAEVDLDLAIFRRP